MTDRDHLSLFYRPPQLTPGMTPAVLRGYRSSEVRARVASGLVGLRAAMDLGLGALVIALPRNATVETTGWDLELDVIYALTSVMSLIAFLCWVHRVHENLPLFTQKSTTTPASAVIAYFAPFSNLWTPYRDMRRAWRVSKPVARDPTRALPVMLWWALICASVGVFVVTTIWSSAHPPPSRAQLETLMLAAYALSIAGGAACVWTVLSLSDRQNEAAARLAREHARQQAVAADARRAAQS